MTSPISYFGVAAIVIALAVIASTMRKKEEKRPPGKDRMNFTIRPPRTVRVVSTVCSAIFGLVLIALLAASEPEQNLPTILIALTFTVIAAGSLYYSFRWKLVIAEDELLLTPLFGKKMKITLKDITHIEIKSINFTDVYNNKKKLFSAPGLSQGGSALVSYFIEKGVRVPTKINWRDNNWY